MRCAGERAGREGDSPRSSARRAPSRRLRRLLLADSLSRMLPISLLSPSSTRRLAELLATTTTRRLSQSTLRVAQLIAVKHSLCACWPRSFALSVACPVYLRGAQRRDLQRIRKRSHVLSAAFGSARDVSDAERALRGAVPRAFFAALATGAGARDLAARRPAGATRGGVGSRCWVTRPRLQATVMAGGGRWTVASLAGVSRRVMVKTGLGEHSRGLGGGEPGRSPGPTPWRPGAVPWWLAR